jgi:two-component system OmpR family sensor kinase
MALSFKLRVSIASLLLASIFLALGSFGTNHLLKAVEKNTAQSILDSEVNSLLISITALGINGSKATLSPKVPGQLVLVVDPQGRILLNSLSIMQPAEIDQLLIHPKQNIFKFHSHEGDFWISKRVKQGTDGVWQILVAHDNNLTEMFAEKTFQLFVYIGFFLLLIVVLGSWLLARYILLPVTQIQRQAQSMIDMESDELLPVSPAGDELTDLSLTLNTLLSRLHSSLSRERQLVADVSHELRTPLAILQGKLQLLERQQEEVSRDDLLGLIRISQRIISLTENLLFLAHPATDADVVQLHSKESKVVVAESIDHARILDLGKNLNINFEVSLDRDVAISPENLRRILDNLLSNAVANCEAEGDIDLYFTQNDDYANLTITDSGQGFPEDFIPIAFERFTRADSSRNRERGGSGLGLSLVKSIVDANGGRVTIENREDGGAQVEVLLKFSN